MGLCVLVCECVCWFVNVCVVTCLCMRSVCEAGRLVSCGFVTLQTGDHLSGGGGEDFGPHLCWK